jgi:hypothetical protein
MSPELDEGAEKNSMVERSVTAYFACHTMSATPSETPPDDLHTPEEIAAFLKVDPKTVLNWEKGGIIPNEFRVGRTVRFSLEAVKASLNIKRSDLGESKRSLEDIVRLAFSGIDPLLFPAPSWMLFVEKLDPRDADHALRIAVQCRKAVEAKNSIPLKMAYFQGVLDWAAMVEAEEK